MKSLPVLGLFMMVCSCIQAQTSIKGKTVDQKDSLGIGFVTVNLLSFKDSVIIATEVTDSTGVFELPGIRNGRYRLLFSVMGYRKLYKEVFLDHTVPNTGDQGIVLLVSDAKYLDEVTVSSGSPAFQRQENKLVISIPSNRLFKTAVNAFDILKKIPGLEVNGDGTIQLSGRITPSVFVDDKPRPMSPEELQNYLSSLSPDMIASIEVINNPSSQYDAEHKAIINIKLKQDRTLGWQGTLSSNIQQNAYTLAENNLLLSYKTPKLTYTLRLGHTTGVKIYRYSALQHLANTNIMATNTEVLNHNNNFNYQFGIDYNLTKKQRVELLLRAYQVNREATSYNTLNITDSLEKKQVSHTTSNNKFDPGQDNYAVNMNYYTQLGKNQLQVLSALVKINNRQHEDIQTKNTLTNDLLDYWKTTLRNDILIRVIQADLSGSLGKGKWNAGAKFAFTTTENNLRYDTLNNGGVFMLDSGRTNSFHYNEYITAAYVSYEGKLNKFNYSAGLRAEQTHSIANSLTQDRVTERNYITWLPSFSITYPIGENRQLNLSFSRRITRPNFTQLNPFRFYISPLNYREGNPYLQPSTTNTLSIAYSQQGFNLSVNIGREEDPMTRYPEYNRVTNVLEYLGKNLPYNDFAGIELSFPLQVSTWWRMNHNIGGYYRKEQIPYHDVVYAIPVTNYSVNGSQVISLPRGFTFDLSYNYRSISGEGLYILPVLYNIDLGLQKKWLKGKLNSRINYYDIFNSYRTGGIFRQSHIINNRLVHWFGLQRIALSLSYSFGKSTYKARQNKKNEEESRSDM